MTAQKATAAFTLDDTDEFEAAIIEIVRTHRDKSAKYGNEGDKLQNFYDTAVAQDLTPMQVAEVLRGKHLAALKQWRARGSDYYDPYAQDAVVDTAVYSVIIMILFERAREAS